MLKGYFNFRRQGINGEYIINPSLYEFLFTNPKVEKRYKVVNGYNSDEIIINKHRFKHIVVRKKGGSVSDTILLNYIECEENELKSILADVKDIFKNTELRKENNEFVIDYKTHKLINFDGVIDIK